MVRKLKDYDALGKYSKFDNKKDMNAAFKYHTKQINGRKDLTPAWKDKLTRLLDLIQDYSIKVVGVCWLSQSNIASLLGLRKRQTAGLWLAKAEAEGYIKRFKCKRSKDNRQTSDIIVVMPVKNSKKEHKEIQENGHPKDISSLKSLNSFKENVDTPVNNTVDLPVDNLEDDTTKYLPAYIPSAFIKIAKKLSNSSDDIYKFWKKISLASKITGLVEYNVAAIGVKAAKTTYKNRARIKDKSTNGLLGYFFGTIKRMMENALEKDLQADNDKHYGRDGGNSVPKHEVGKVDPFVPKNTSGVLMIDWLNG